MTDMTRKQGGAAEAAAALAAGAAQQAGAAQPGGATHLRSPSQPGAPRPPAGPPGVPAMPRRGLSMFDRALVRPALVDAIRKLDPRVQWRNPVMFVVFIGSLLTTGLWIQALIG